MARFLTLKNVTLNGKVIANDSVIEMTESELTAKLVARKTLKVLSDTTEQPASDNI